MVAYSKEELLILGGFSTGETKADNKYERSIYKLKCSSGTVYRLDSNIQGQLYLLWLQFPEQK